MNSKFTNSFLITLIVTLSIFSISKIDFSQKFHQYFPSRLLSDKTMEDYTNEVCGNSSTDLVSKYTSKNFNYDVPKGNDYIIDLINNNFNISNIQNEEFIRDYTLKNKGYLTIFILCILLLVLWIPYICCICCRCCVCIPDSCTKFAKLYLLIGLCLIAGVSICCFIGYSENTGILEGIFGIGCGVFKIENHLAHGDECEIKPYWIGVTGIISKLNTTVTTIKNITEQAQNLQKDLKKINNDEMETSLNNEYKDKSNTQISSPLPNEEKYFPEYLEKYGPVTDSNTVLGAINTEHKTFIENSVNTIDNILSVINLTNSTVDSVTDQITSIENTLGTGLDDFETNLESAINQYYDYLNLGDTYFRISMNLCFSFNLIVAIAVAISLLFLLMCQKGKCLLAVAWFVIFAFMIFSLLFGVVFGICSNVFKDATYGIDYSLKNIKTLNISKQLDDTAKYAIDICINGNGSLANSELIDISSMAETEIINNIYTLEKNITEGKSLLQNYQLISINTTLEKMDEIKETPTSKLIQAFGEVQKYTDASVDSSQVEKSEIYDVWVLNKNYCPDGYNYISKTSSLRNLKTIDGSCLVISEWSDEDVNKRYKDLKTDSGEECLTKILSYYNSIKKFLDENTNLLDDISKSIEGFNQIFKENVNKEIVIIDGIWDAVKPMKDLYQEFVGNSSIFDMLNCGFLKRDMNILLEQINEGLGGSLKATSNIFIAIGLFEFVLTLLVLILMKSFKNDGGEVRDRSGSVELMYSPS